MQRGRHVLRLGLLVATAAVAVYGPTSTASATGGGGVAAKTILGSGSDTTQFMMQSMDGLYQFSPGCAQVPTPSGPSPWLDFSCQSPDPAGTITTENYQHDQVREAYFLGSSSGIKQLCTQGLSGVAPIDFARSSRGTKTGDCTGLHFVAYARDGISWEAFDDGTTSSGIHAMNNQSGSCSGSSGTTQFCLSQQNLKDIYINCTVTNWNQVGGQNVPISIYTPQSGSGTRSTWDGFLGGDSSHCIPSGQLGTHLIPENSNAGIPTSDRAGAIFPFSFGVWSTQVGTSNSIGAKLGAVDKVVPTATTIGDSTFPYGRYLYNVYCSATAAAGGPSGCSSSGSGGHASSTATVNYVGEEGWICKLGSNHSTNPSTGNVYRSDTAGVSGDIEKTITAAGFVPIPSGTIGGGDLNSDYCRLFTT